MNRILTAAVVVALVAASVPVLTRGQVSGTMAPSPNVVMPKEVASPTLIQAQGTPRPSDADARACLDLPSNDAIIRCAEKFLPRPRGG